MSEPTLVSLFDGIGGFPLGFSRAGFRTVATVEIDKAAAGVAAMHFPDAQHFSDVTEVTGAELLAAGFDPRRGVVTGGWPCTDLSLAGLRLGLGGARSGLVGQVFRILGELRPRWFVLENVPGLLSSVCPCPGGNTCGGGQRTVRDDDGNERIEAVPCADSHSVRGGACGRRVRRGRAVGVGRCMALHGGGMGTVLRSLGELGYGLAYRVLDAQYLGVPQRRRRVIIVGCLGDWAAPVSVLFEPSRSGGDHPASSTPGPGTAGRAGVSTRGTGTAVNALTTGSIAKYDDNTAQAGQLVAGTLPAHASGGIGWGSDEAASGLLVPMDVAGALTAKTGGADDNDASVGHLVSTLQGGGRRGQRLDAEMAAGGQLVPVVTHALTAEGADASEDGTGRGTPLVAMAFDLAPHGEGPISPDRPVPTLNTFGAMSVATGGEPEIMPTLTASTALGNTSQDEQVIAVDLVQVTAADNRSNPQPGDPSATLNTAGQMAVAFGHANGIDPQASEHVTPTLRNESAGAAVATGGEPAYALRANPGGVGQGHNTNHVPGLTAVRRLTPVECERLQGYPDGWTAVSAGREQKDSPRYKQLGNSIAVPVFEWVARRIAAYDAEHYREDQA